MRAKEFGEGPRVALDREAKVRIMHLARTLRRVGRITYACVEVLQAMLWLIHDGRSGQCNPSYDTIAAKANCARSTVHRAIVALERAGILSWVNRIRRVRDRVRDELLGGWMLVWRVLRTSNAYVFRNPGGGNGGKPTKSDNRTGPIDGSKKEGHASLPPELAASLEAYGAIIAREEYARSERLPP
jgi:predicted transcriptional regulator